MKGITVIDAVVLIVLALVVLLAILMFFFGAYNPGKSSTDLETAKNNACRIYTTLGCPAGVLNSIQINDFDADKNGVIGNVGTGGVNCGEDMGDNLYTLCQCYYSADEDVCRENVCGCIV